MPCCPSTSCPGGLGASCYSGTCQDPGFPFPNLSLLTCDDALCNAYCLCPDNKPEGGGTYTSGHCILIPVFNVHECNCM